MIVRIYNLISKPLREWNFVVVMLNLVIAGSYYQNVFRFDVSAMLLFLITIQVTSRIGYWLLRIVVKPEDFEPMHDPMIKVMTESSSSLRAFIESRFSASMEDMCFVLPLLFIKKPEIAWCAVAVSAIVFTILHRNYGTSYLIKIIYVPIAYYVASRYGIITTVCAHFINNMLPDYFRDAYSRFVIWLAFNTKAGRKLMALFLKEKVRKFKKKRTHYLRYRRMRLSLNK